MVAVRAASERYARWLARGAAVGVAVMLVGFVAYLSGVLAPSLPLERLPALWSMPAAEVLRVAGLRPGLGWIAHLHHGDAVSLLGIALLAGCSVPALAAVMPIYARQRRRAFVLICALEILVIVAAASGMLEGTGH